MAANDQSLSLRSQEHMDRAYAALATGHTDVAADSLAEVIVHGTEPDRENAIKFLEAYTQ
ncbi:hypothetical protein [Streptomyces pilosus]|uniref:hypothetical protein n=1 Tax=Streptomyces pilosus TaxID=28893 RepID=UPI0036419E2F